LLREQWEAMLILPVQTLHLILDSELQDGELQDSGVYNVGMATPSSNRSIKSVKITMWTKQSLSCRQYMLRTLSTMPCVEELELQCKIDRNRCSDKLNGFSAEQIEEDFMSLRKQLNLPGCSVLNRET